MKPHEELSCYYSMFWIFFYFKKKGRREMILIQSDKTQDRKKFTKCATIYIHSIFVLLPFNTISPRSE